MNTAAAARIDGPRLLRELGAALEGARTRAALARSVARVARRFCLASRLDYGFSAGGDDRYVTVEMRRGRVRIDAQGVQDDWHRKLFRQAIKSRHARIRRPDLDVPPETVVAGGQTARALEVASAVAIRLGAPGVGMVLWTPALGWLHPLLEMSSHGSIEALVRVAHESIATIERVARCSRRAQRDSSVLRDILRDPARRIVARSEAMRDLLELVDLLAESALPVLLRGESGTGKGLLARRIHEQSGREGPLVVLNCATVPAGLIESELLGHEAGAFPGATARRRGAFERARGGTLFLDEIAELSAQAQLGVFRALQDGTVLPVGAERRRSVDVRVVAATNRPMEQMVAAQTFREDLFHRLTVMPVAVPPLRDRREDIPILARELLLEAGARLGLAAPRLRADQLEALAHHAWPGNVRELAQVLERALLSARGGPLELGELDPRAAEEAAETFEAAMRRCIEDALRASGGQVSGEGCAAAQLGVHPNTLHSRMRKLGISRRDFG